MFNSNVQKPLFKHRKFFFHTDATRMGRDLCYLVRWQDGSKFFHAKDAHTKWPNLVIDFLEQNLSIN